MKERMKKSFALLLCVLMCLSLLPEVHVHAEDAAGEEAVIVADTQGKEQAVTNTEPEEALAAVEGTAEPVTEPDVEAAPVSAAVRVSFNCTPAETLIWVYDAEDEDTELEPEEDGSYLLVPGEYVYVAFCEGYTGAYEELLVEESDEDLVVDVVLEENEETETATTYSSSSTGWLWPVKSSKTISSNFGMRDLDGDGTKESFHSGIDISVARGSEVRAAKSGQIIDYVNKYAWDEKVWSSDMSSFGNYVAIKHDDGTYAIYAHLSPEGMTTSGYVNQGDTIALSGNSGASSGAHLHFQVSKSNNGWSSAANVINTMPTEETISRLGLTVVNGYQAASGYDTTRMEYIYELNTVPEAPKLIGFQDNYPTKSGNQTTLTFQWTDVGADMYYLEFATLQNDGTYKNWEDILGYSGTQSIGLLFNTGWYCVDIYATNSAGKSSSTRYYFSVGNIPPEYTSAVPVNSVEFNDHLYERYDYHMRWTEAKEYCEKLGGHLVTITSAEEQNTVVGLLTGLRNGMYYIGCTDLTLSGNWSWITGEAFSYSNWDTTEPSKSDGEFYGEIMARTYGAYKELGDWNDVEDAGNNYYACGNTGFICEYDSVDPCHSGHTWDQGTITTEPTCTETGIKTYTCSVCGDSYTESIAALGHTYTSQTIGGSCTQRPSVKYTCTRCGDTYTEYADGNWSEWSTTKPSGVPESAIQTKTQYRYRDKETTTSSSSTLDGWTLSGSETVWSDYGAWSDWSRTYVAASDSTQVETAPLYRYYYFLCHGCGDHNPLSSACGCGSTSNSWVQRDSTIPYNQSNSTAVSYATYKRQTTSLGDGQLWYFSTGNLNDTAIGTVDSDSSETVINQGYRYRTRTQSTVYNFYRWADWSSWSDTAVTASDSREVETRQMYRYDLYATAEHSWDSGVVTTAAGCETEGVMTYTCTACGETRTETIPATGHSWGEWIVTTEPTLSADGVETRTCQNCGKTETRSVAAVIYTVSYNANGGSGAPASQQKLKGTALTLSSTKPTRSGYTFLGWAASSTATAAQYQPGGSYTADKDITLYAVWKKAGVEKGQLTVSTPQARPGETVAVDVSIAENPGICAFTIQVDYDDTVLELVSIEHPEIGSNSIWNINGGMVSWLSFADSDYNGTLFTVTFKVADNAEEGTTAVTVLYESGDIGNFAEEEINPSVQAGGVNIVNRVPGDTNGDGRLNTMDLIRLMKYFNGESVEVVPGSADINGDGRENTMDLIRLMKYISGEDVEIH